jgi:Ca-activated chloride channel family protein
MRSDHDENERKDDELDAAMRQHQRPAPPDDLVDRCLSTIPSPRYATDFRGPAMPGASKVGERHVVALIPWALAACFVIGAAAAFFVYNARQTERTSNSLAILQSVDRMRSEMQGGIDGLNPQVGYLTDEAFERQIKDQQRNYEALLQNYQATKDALESAELAQNRGDQTRDRAKEVALLREQLKQTREQKDEALRRQFEATQQHTELKGSYENLESRAKHLEAKRSEILSAIPFGDDSTKGFDSRVYSRITAGSKAEVTGLTTGKPGVTTFSVSDPTAEVVLQDGSVRFKVTGGAGGFGSFEKGKQQELLLREERISEGLPRTSLEAEAYAPIADNPFLSVDKSPLSTFSTDVDTASYSNMRRFLSQGSRPPRDAVRIEELINYFSYDYPQPLGNDPFSVNLEVAGCPWNADHRLVRIGLKGREIADQQRPPANLVFLIDVSGSMQPDNKLPLLKNALRMLVQKLGENERVAIVTYANEIRLVLPSTTCDSKETIIQAIESLQAGGGTNGGGGIQLAYQVAIENFLERGVNRVILSTDGDFNIGITDRDELTRFIEEKAKSKVFLSVLGFGMGNLKDATLERLADKGNGHYAYIDTMAEARKVLVDQLNGTLVTIAKDVKLQVEFNPAQVSAYRLIGYENRVMAAQDFNDDRKDAGDIGAGHTVTALYEIVPVGKSAGPSGVDPLKYQRVERPAEPPASQLDGGPASAIRRELLTVKLRYKQPDGVQSRLLEAPLSDSDRRYSEASRDFRFAAAVAAFGMILRDSPHRGTATLSGVLELAEDGLVADREGYRAEFLKLVRMAQAMP